jgi:hypothetical protein
MRVPTEDDWRLSEKLDQTDQDHYEEHVRRQALRLREANTVAGQNYKLSYRTAKQFYYDKQTKLTQFKKGDLVYLHDPICKRGRAKKCSYQFQGPFEIELKTSPLIYRLRTGEGMSTVVHINRLKPETSTSTNVSTPALSSKVQQKRKKSKSDSTKEYSSQQIPPRARITASVDENSDDSDDIESLTPGKYESS